MAQALFLGRLIEMTGRHQGIRPDAELLAMLGRTRPQDVKIACRRQQRIKLLLLLVQTLEQKPFANTRRRHDDVLGLGDADDLFEHDGAISQKRTPCTRHGVDGDQRIDAHALHQCRKIRRVACRDDVVVHNVQRIIALAHVQARKCPPGAADGVEMTVL